MDGYSEAQAIRNLRWKAAGTTVLGFILLWSGLPVLSGPLPAAAAFRWLALASSAWLYFSIILWNNLKKNRAGDGTLHPTLGPANGVTLFRAVLMAAFTGLLLVPRLEGSGAWLPGLLYTAAALPDYVDGIIARRTGRVTPLGEVLDMNVDSVGVFAAAALAVLYGIVPSWYLPIGLARYLFVIGIRLRERFGLPIRELPPSVRRRGFAALKMGFMFVVLFPVFGPPATHLAAAAFGLPFAVGFIWDWGLVTGRIRPGAWGRDSAVVHALVEKLPVLLRTAAVVLTLSAAGRHLADPDTRAFGFLEVGAAILIGLGVATHSAAMLAAVLLGLSQNLAPLTPAGSLLVFVLIGLIFLGGGRFALLPVEDRLIQGRIGDPG